MAVQKLCPHFLNVIWSDSLVVEINGALSDDDNVQPLLISSVLDLKGQKSTMTYIFAPYSWFMDLSSENKPCHTSLR